MHGWLMKLRISAEMSTHMPVFRSFFILYLFSKADKFIKGNTMHGWIIHVGRSQPEILNPYAAGG